MIVFVLPGDSSSQNFLLCGATDNLEQFYELNKKTYETIETVDRTYILNCGTVKRHIHTVEFDAIGSSLEGIRAVLESLVGTRISLLIKGTAADPNSGSHYVLNYNIKDARGIGAFCNRTDIQFSFTPQVIAKVELTLLPNRFSN